MDTLKRIVNDTVDLLKKENLDIKSILSALGFIIIPELTAHLYFKMKISKHVPRYITIGIDAETLINNLINKGILHRIEINNESYFIIHKYFTEIPLDPNNTIELSNLLEEENDDIS